MPFAAAFIVLGKAFGEGNSSRIVTAIGLFVAAVIVFQVLRRKFTKRENGA
jgi:threonine/homoserine efflux transporter RhtA